MSEKHIAEVSKKDTISRQAAIIAIGEYYADKKRFRKGRSVLTAVCLDLQGVMEDLPSIQPKRGRWVKMSDSFGTYYACSCCGEDCTPHGMKTRFCPSCGADMRGGQDE